MKDSDIRWYHFLPIFILLGSLARSIQLIFAGLVLGGGLVRISQGNNGMFEIILCSLFGILVIGEVLDVFFTNSERVGTTLWINAYKVCLCAVWFVLMSLFLAVIYWKGGPGGSYALIIEGVLWWIAAVSLANIAIHLPLCVKSVRRKFLFAVDDFERIMEKRKQVIS